MRGPSKWALAAAACAAAIFGWREARAFCGFYVSGADAKLFNDATQVVLMREGTRTVLSMQNAYQGPPEAFAMVVPVPVVLQKENVKTLPRAIFERVDQLTAPRLVEYWEQDPCAPVPVYKPGRAAGAGMVRSKAAAEDKADADYGVKVEAQFTVGEYEIVILSAQDSSGLERWLRDNKYKIPDGAEPYLRPYVQAGSKFFVAKVDPKKVTFEGGRATLSPLRFHYDSDRFELPVRLGLMNSSGTQDLIVNVLAKGTRYEVANSPNKTIPTNLDVAEEARGSFGAMYAALFDKTIASGGPRTVVTEYAWDASSCDPCPTPPLSPADLTTLGADVLPSATANHGDVTPAPSPRGRAWGGGWRGGFTVTRLHARYTKDALSEDLVFRAAPPIAGGREWQQPGGGLEKGSLAAPMNNFQARYAIRHRWPHPIACEHPVRGRWGGPPGGTGAKGAEAATKLAFAPRDGAKLASLVQEDVPEIGLVSLTKPAPLDVAPPPPATASSAPAPGAPKPQGGCSGCTEAGGARAPGWALTACAGALAAAITRRRRRPS